MGCINSAEEREARRRSKEIDKYLEESAFPKRDVTILVLGNGDAGINTLFKQIKIIYHGGLTPTDLETYRPIVYHNAIQSLASILGAMPELNISFGSDDRKSDAQTVFDEIKERHDSEPVSEKLLSAMERLWNNFGVQRTFVRDNEYQLMDSGEYFLNNLSRIGAKDYRPSNDDVLRARVRVTRWRDIHIPYNTYTIQLVSMGGSRKTRNLWASYLDNATAVILCASLSEYDQVLHEDEQSNRMKCSLQRFESICRNRRFKNTPTILLLNKKDIFEEKIKRSPLTICFPEYRGGQSDDEALAYIQSQFELKNEYTRNEVHTFMSCAVDTDNIHGVLEEICELVTSIDSTYRKALV